MIWFLYNVLFLIGFTLMLPKFVWRMLRRGGYRRGFMQRLAVYDGPTLARLAERPRIWIHAVSVGEMYVALRLMDELRARDAAAAFVITTTTSTAHRIATDRLPPGDVLLYFPVDVPPVVRRVLRAVKPKAILLTESEFWPNLIRLASKQGIPVAVINGRISEKSFRGYRRVRCFTWRMLQGLSKLLVQSEGDRERLVALGADPTRVRVVGTVKYDMLSSASAVPGPVQAWLTAQGVTPGVPVIVGGSTWEGEERALVQAWRRVKTTVPDVRLVLVPRHAERGSGIEQALQRAGDVVVRRSQNAVQASGNAVILVDSTGELMDVYARASVVFVGKSLLHHGGQNFIEPALLGKAVVTGPNLENFPGVAEEFLAARAIRQVRNEAELADALEDLLTHAEVREQMAQRGHDLVRSRQGAVRRMAEEVEALSCTAGVILLLVAAIAVALPTGAASREMRIIPGGPFRMGSVQAYGWPDERPAHDVNVSTFLMDRCEVSNGEMCRVMGWALQNGAVVAGPQGVTNLVGSPQELIDLSDWNCEIAWQDGRLVPKDGRENFPCVEVTWFGAVAYANYLSDMEGLEVCVDLSTWTCDFARNGYRLPTEAEWEKAARGGMVAQHFPWASAGTNVAPFLTGERANFWGSGDPYETNPNQQATPVGYYNGQQIPAGADMANAFGLYDMAGNVYEWCWDYYDPDWYAHADATKADTRGQPLGYGRVVRGGSWMSGNRDDARGTGAEGALRYLRCANRAVSEPTNGRNNRGFRCARSADALP